MSLTMEEEIELEQWYESQRLLEFELEIYEPDLPPMAVELKGFSEVKRSLIKQIQAPVPTYALVRGGPSRG